MTRFTHINIPLLISGVFLALSLLSIQLVFASEVTGTLDSSTGVATGGSSASGQLTSSVDGSNGSSGGGSSRRGGSSSNNSPSGQVLGASTATTPLLPSAGFEPEKSSATTALIDISVILSATFFFLFLLMRSRNTKYRG